MKISAKPFISFILILCLCLSLSFSVYAEDETQASEETSSEEETREETEEESSASSDEWPEAPELISGSALVVDMTTGAVLFDQESDEKIYPASTTKLLTCLIALEYCSLDEIVTFSAEAVDLVNASSIDAVEGEEMVLEDVLYGLMLPSGNDCANAIAEHISGSISAFAELMNEYAESLGCTSTHFTNPSGTYDTDHYTTAQDMYLIAQAAFSNSTLVDIISHTTYTIAATNLSEEREISTTNAMITSSSEYYNSSVIGGKTGYTSQAGRALVILSEQDNMKLVCLFFDCADYTGVFEDAQNLLDYVYDNFSIINISQEEIRFSSSFEDAKVELDSTDSIVIPNTMSLSDLDFEIIFATDMGAEEFGEAKLDAGITTQDGRHLYASIEYYYDGNYLGNVYVVINDNLEIAASSMANIYYVNFGWAIAAAILALAVMAAVIKLAAVRRKRLRKLKFSSRR